MQTHVHTSAPTNTYSFTQGADTSRSICLRIDGITGLRQKYLLANGTRGSEFSWKCLETGLSLILSARCSFTRPALGEEPNYFLINGPVNTSGFWCQMQMSRRIGEEAEFQTRERCFGRSAASLAAFYTHSWRKKRQTWLCVGVDALAQRHFLSSTISSISLWVGSQGVGLSVMDSSCRLLFVCALDLSTCLSLRAGRSPGGIWLHRCEVSVLRRRDALVSPEKKHIFLIHILNIINPIT